MNTFQAYERDRASVTFAMFTPLDIFLRMMALIRNSGVFSGVILLKAPPASSVKNKQHSAEIKRLKKNPARFCQGKKTARHPAPHRNATF
jgi:hypothetical protein